MVKLNLPNHVRITLDRKEDDGESFDLRISGWNRDGHSRTLRKVVPAKISALKLGKDLVAAINTIYDKVTKS